MEHPQELINKIQLGDIARFVEGGRGKVPVADYRLATEVGSQGDADSERRPVFSFCMCPGGQIGTDRTVLALCMSRFRSMEISLSSVRSFL